jgi:class 3 adenylate cyclase
MTGVVLGGLSKPRINRMDSNNGRSRLEKRHKSPGDRIWRAQLARLLEVRTRFRVAFRKNSTERHLAWTRCNITAGVAILAYTFPSDTIAVMGLTEELQAWLEREDQQHILEASCSIGRATLNTLVLDSAKVSRLHAIIHSEHTGAFWLVDLGSSNGTFLNKRRLHEPARLRDCDQITIGGNTFTFRQSRDPSDRPRTTAPVLTLQEQIEEVPCWLLVADIKNFTPLSRELLSDKLATLVGSWLATCKDIIEKHRGVVNKYLGDGILAYWPDEEGTAKNIVAVIDALKQAQTQSPEFRFIVHFGSVAIGGVAPVREETLMGSEVNLVFRLEKLLASLGEQCGISDAAHIKLKELLSLHPLGNYELKGFEGKRSLFAV